MRSLCSYAILCKKSNFFPVHKELGKIRSDAYELAPQKNLGQTDIEQKISALVALMGENITTI